MTADDGLLGVGVVPLLLDDVGDGAAVRTFDADAGIEPVQRHLNPPMITTSFDCSSKPKLRPLELSSLLASDAALLTTWLTVLTWIKLDESSDLVGGQYAYVLDRPPGREHPARRR